MTLHNESHVSLSIISILDADNQVTGYGFFIDPHGLAITCYHLISNLQNIRIRDYYGHEYDAVINKYYSSLRNDIAVIHIQKDTRFFLYFSYKAELIIDVSHPVFSQGKHTWEFEDIRIDKCDYHLQTTGMHGLPVLVTDTLNVWGIKISDRYSRVLLLNNPKRTGQFEMLREYLSKTYLMRQYLRNYGEIATIFNLQALTAINSLIDKGIYLPEYYCSRDEDTKIHSFIHSSGHIKFIIGDTGVGKTSLLAYAATQSISAGYVLFFSAWQFELRPHGLRGEIKRLLQQTLTEHPQEIITIDDLMHTVCNSIYNNQCIIFIDGLNEMSNQFAGKFNSWIKHSIGWAKNTNIKLIITSTKPFYKHPGIRMGSFNVKQTNEAFSLYNLPEKFKTISRLSHPLVIRLLHDISSQAISTVPDDYPLVATYIQRKCASIARLTNIPSNTILNLLILLASHSENHWLSYGTYQDILKDHPDLIPILIQENLFFLSNNGIRIIFPWIGEFLAGESLDLQVPWDQLNPTQKKGLPWLISKHAFLQQDVSPVMQQLLSSIVNNHPEKEKAVDILINTIQHLSHPDKHYTTIETFTLHEQNGFFLPHEVGPLVFHSHLSYPNQLKLIKIALSTITMSPHLIHFYFSCHIYHPQNLFLEPIAPFSTKQALHRYLEIQRDKTIDTIMQWLYDYDGVSDLPMINVIACIILHQFYCYGKTSKTSFNVRDKLFVNYNKQDNTHLSPIIKEICSLIVASKPEFEYDFYKYCAELESHINILRRKSYYHFYIKWLPPVMLDIIRNTTTFEKLLYGITWLIRVPEYTEEMLHQALILLKENKLHFRNCETLLSCINIEEYFDIILPELICFIKNGEDRRTREMCIGMLFIFKNNEEHNLVLAQHLALLMEEVPELDRKLTQYFVAALVKVPYHSKAYTILNALIPKLLPRDLHIWYPIMKHLCREETCSYTLFDKLHWIRWAFNNLELRPLCTLTILLLNTKVMKDEDQIIALIKPVILKTMESSDQFYEAVLKKSKKKNYAVYYDIINDEDFKSPNSR